MKHFQFSRLGFQVFLLSWLALGLLIWDSTTNLGIGNGVLYLLLVLATLPILNKNLTLGVIGCSTILIVIGFFTSPWGMDQYYALINRVFSVLSVWITGFMVWKNIVATQNLQSLKTDLEHQFEMQTMELQNQNLAMLNVLDDMETIKATLEEKEGRLKLFIDAFPTGMVMVDEKGTITLCNQLIPQLFGYTKEEMMGQSIELLLPERFRLLDLQHDTAFMADPHPRALGAERNLIARRKDGTEFPVDIGLNSLTTGKGIFVLASIVDITERQQAERNLASQNLELTRSNEELEQFAYIASHDLKEPLRGINNFSKILIEDYGKDFNEDALSKCETLIRLSMRMENLVDSLLYYSRVGRTGLAMRPTNLDQTIQDMLDSLEVTLREQNAAIIYPQALPTVYCDSVRTGEIFLNLVTNALKYNDKHEKRIEIGYYQSDLGLWESRQISQGIPVFYVKDNGIGIRDKHFQNIFRIFKRLHARDKFGGGTGVGLTITKKLIERHGGEIWIDSTVGEGTTFYFTLEGETRHDRHTQPAHSVSGG